MKPEQKRDEKARRVLSRQHVSRADKHQKHPSNDWHPLTDEGACSCVQIDGCSFTRTTAECHVRSSTAVVDPAENAQRSTSNAQHRTQKGANQPMVGFGRATSL